MKETAEYSRELGEEEKERIISDFLPFIKYTAHRLSWRLPPQLSVEDLVSVGIIGLLDALTRYREDVGRLGTFAEIRIKGAMLDELRAHDATPKSLHQKVKLIKEAHKDLEKELGRLPDDEEIARRLEMPLDEYYGILSSAKAGIHLSIDDFSERTHQENGLDIMDSIPDPQAKNPLKLFEDKRERELLAGVISELPEKEKLVLSLYYWEEMTMKEISRAMNLTEGRVSQLHHQALLRLKTRVESLRH